MMLAVAILATTGLSAQDEKIVEKVDKKQLRKEKKAKRKAEFELFKSAGLNQIEDRDFVLMADQISGRLGRPILVTDNLNFVKIDGDEITVQYALLNRVGFNGLGGITWSGKIEKLESEDLGKGKAGSVRIDFTSRYVRGMASLHIRILGDRATAQLLNNGQIINFAGEYLFNAEAIVNEGRNIGAF